MCRVFANSPGDRGSIPGQVIPKTQKMILDAALLCTIRWGSRVKWSNPGNGVAPSLHLGIIAIEKGAFKSLLTMVTNFTLIISRDQLLLLSVQSTCKLF